MSEEICKVCGYIRKFCTCEGGFQGPMLDGKGEKRIIVDVRDSAERRRLEDERDAALEKQRELEGMLVEKVDNEFSRDKYELKIQFPAASGMIDLVPTPSLLEEMAAKLKAGKHAPHGKSPAQPSNSGYSGDGEQFESQTAMLDELYSRAYDRRRHITGEGMRQSEDAKAKINELWKNYGSSPAKAEMKRKGGLSGVVGEYAFVACPHCGATVDTDKTDTCYKCGGTVGKNNMERSPRVKQ